jgi:hypothetical protein
MVLTITWVDLRSFTLPVGPMPRRKFFDAVKLNPQDQTAIRIVAQMDELFAIDALEKEA